MNCTGIKVWTSSLSLEKGIQKYTCERRGVKFPTYGQRSQPKGFKVHPSTWVHMLKFGFQTIFLGKSTQWPSKLSRFKLPGLLQKKSYFCSFVFHHSCNEKKPNTLDSLGSYFLQFQTWSSPLCVPALEPSPWAAHDITVLIYYKNT
jgi:hypothetical protein